MGRGNQIKTIGSSSCQTRRNKQKTKNSSCKLIMYDQTYFRGKSVEVTNDTKDFKAIKFDNALASLKIEGNCCWTLFVDPDYKDGQTILGSGEYKSGNDFKEVFKKASSAKKS